MAEHAQSNPSGYSLLGSGAALLTILACKGAGIAVALASLFGLTLSINIHVQAALISLFAVLTTGFVYLNFRWHRQRSPLILAVVAAAALIGTMYIVYSTLVEVAALVVLLTAAIWSWHAARRRTMNLALP